MSEEMFSAPPRPRLALRIGVTGARALADVEALRPLVKEALRLIRDEAVRVAAEPHVAASYDAAPPLLRMISPLAEGADRLVAEEGDALRFELYAPLPFAQADYEQDFLSTVARFREMLPKDEKFELDGVRSEPCDESYREVGKFVLRNCELLIALWDGERENGPGGSGEIVRTAVQSRLPVWWIDARGRKAPVFLEGPRDLARAASDGTDAERLKNYIARVIEPPPEPPSEPIGLFEWAASRIEKLVRIKTEPLAAYLAERPLSTALPWRLFDLLIDALARAEHEPLPPLDWLDKPAEHYWRAFFVPADRLAIAYAARYRSSYVWIALLVFLALAAAGFDGAARWLLPAYEFNVVLCEIAALGALAVLVFCNILFRWHSKWVSYRLLAELCRKQQALSALGRALPNPEVFRISCGCCETKAPLADEFWAPWYFSAAQRAAPLPRSDGSDRLSKTRALLLSLCEQQQAYHTRRGAQMTRASRSIGFAGECAFLATAAAAVVKGVFAWGEAPPFVDIMGAVGAGLSAASAGFVGIKAYSEFMLLTRQSAHMLRVLAEIKEDLNYLDPKAPYAGRELGRLMDALTLAMMQDVGGWAQLYRIKTLEAGG